ncbi:MAG: cation:proton antiporter, partial [Saprospiraceae bacterium]|nr:cation:proton antiporter [Saprospiraceae bacterium]
MAEANSDHVDIFTIITVVIVLTSLFGYLNVRFLKLPTTIGVLILAIVFSSLILLVKPLYGDLYHTLHDFVLEIDFSHVLLDVLLGFLLFAGAMHTNFDQLKVQRWPVLVFATVGVLTSTFLFSALVYFLFPWLGLEVRFIHCLLFGALISPTDPIAVLGILK